MLKKIAGLALAITLISSTPVFASTKPDANLKAAPALAVEILEDHGVNPTGEIMRLVAQNVGPKASFMGVQKSDPMYKHKVMHYLHHTLNVIEMGPDACEHHGMMK
jgi:hypothetical protein